MPGRVFGTKRRQHEGSLAAGFGAAAEMVPLWAVGNTSIRGLSSNNRSGPNRGRGGPRNNRGGSYGGPPGRSSNNYRGQEGNKKDLMKDYIKPAIQGTLDHKVHIPKSYGRKPHASLSPDDHRNMRRANTGSGWEDVENPYRRDGSYRRSRGDERPPRKPYQNRRTTQDPSDNSLDLRSWMDGKAPKFLSQEDPYFALEELWDENKYYWNEDDYDDYMPPGFQEAQLFNEDGSFTMEYTDEDLRPKPPRWLDPDVDEQEFALTDEQSAEVESQQLDQPQNLDNAAEDEGKGQNNEVADLDVTEEGDDLEEQMSNIFQIKGRVELQNKNALKTLQRETPEQTMDPDVRYFIAETDIREIAKRPDRDFPDDDDPNVARRLEFNKIVLPLEDHMGDGTVLDFLQAMHEHPTDYARVSSIPLHPNEMREPLPMFAALHDVVQQPPLEYVTSYLRFLYVTGLPPLTVNGEIGDIENPVHRSELEHRVAALLNVNSTQVWAANSTSAFVGFDSPRALANALKMGPKETTQKKPPTFQKFDDKLFPDTKISVKDFVASSNSADCILYLTNLPLECSKESLAMALIPANSKLQELCGNLLPQDIDIPGDGTALVRFSSPEIACSVLKSPLFQQNLESMGVYTIRFLRARRELKHAGFHKFDKTKELRKYGSRLVVDGLHLPSKVFYQSHASSLYLRNLDPTMTEQDLNKIFQKYSKRLRFKSSIEFVRCELTGEPILGTAFVGFEEPDEAENCWNNLRETENNHIENPKVHKFDKGLFPEMTSSIKSFVESSTSPDCIVYITGLPINHTKESLAMALIPNDTEHYRTYGKLSPEDIEIMSDGAALVRLASAETSDSMLQSSLFQHHLKTGLSSPRIKIGDRMASLHYMRDRHIRKINTDPETRSVRSIEELEDDMNNWQKYVDPADIEYLDKNGAPRVVIDETLRGIRRNNPYFGMFDSGIRDEQIEEGKKQGQLYQELVQLYIELLKDCVATRENPGEMLFEDVYPGEEPDYSCFDKWEKEKAEIDAIYLKYMNT